MDSPRETKKEEDVAASPYCRKVDTERTYNRLCAKKRIMYAKEVLAEKKAGELTAKFEQEKDAYFAKKQAAAQQRAKLLYEQQVQARITADQEARINARMRAEERHQVMAMISDSRNRKVGTAMVQEEEGMARDYMRSARMAYDEERRAQRQEKEEERRSALLGRIAEQEEKRREKRLERIQEQGDSVNEGKEKRAKARETVEARRKVLLAAAEEEKKAKEQQYAETLRLAAERRQFTLLAKVDSLHSRSVSCHERAEANLASRDLEARSARAQQTPREREPAPPPPTSPQSEQEERRRLQRLERAEQQELRHRELQQRVEEKHAKVRPTAYVLVSEGDPQLAYLRVKRDMERRRDQAKITKQYDEFFPDAEELCTEKARSDVRMTRLAALEQNVLKAAGSQAANTNYDQLGAAEQQKVFGQRTLRCGLCEQDYAADLLKGKTTVSRIEKLRRGWLGEKGEKAHAHAGSYDQVRLCTLCLQFVRQHAKDAK